MLLKVPLGFPSCRIWLQQIKSINVFIIPALLTGVEVGLSELQREQNHSGSELKWIYLGKRQIFNFESCSHHLLARMFSCQSVEFKASFMPPLEISTYFLYKELKSLRGESQNSLLDVLEGVTPWGISQQEVWTCTSYTTGINLKVPGLAAKLFP